MSKVVRNIVTTGMSGEIGNLIVFRSCGNRTIVTAKPVKSIDFSQCTGNANDPITIVAVDILKVVKVNVKVINESGHLLESGDALQKARWKWEYRITGNYSSIEQFTAKVTAWDKPGNSAEFSLLIKN